MNSQQTLFEIAGKPPKKKQEQKTIKNQTCFERRSSQQSISNFTMRHYYSHVSPCPSWGPFALEDPDLRPWQRPSNREAKWSRFKLAEVCINTSSSRFRKRLPRTFKNNDLQFNNFNPIWMEFFSCFHWVDTRTHAHTTPTQIVQWVSPNSKFIKCWEDISNPFKKHRLAWVELYHH